MTKFSKKAYNKCVFIKRQSAGAGAGCSPKTLSSRKRPSPLKPNEFNIEINYRGPLITPELWCKFNTALRSSVGFNLTGMISELLRDPFLLVCKSTAIIRTNYNTDLNLSPMDNSIMISCDKNIPHYYVYKPNVIHLINKFVRIGNFDTELGVLVPLECAINLFIKNGANLEHHIV